MSREAVRERKMEELRRKPERPSKVEEMLGRERSTSMNNVKSMEEFVKRKRGEIRKEGKEVEIRAK